jgi:hypothetical protein
MTAMGMAMVTGREKEERNKQHSNGWVRDHALF